ncbi:MAG: DMT family transporter [Ruminococcaceae bacterium]|nr:DMT family transporter [Oscillospiraceae bacterium]
MEKSKLPLNAILAAVLCNILFGTAFPMIKIGYELFSVGSSVFDKMLFAGIRFTVAGLLLILFSTLKNKAVPTFPKNRFPLILLIGFIYTSLQYLLFYVGLSNISGASGSVISSSSVFITVILAHFIYKADRINVYKIIGVTVGFGGVLIAVLAGESFEGSFSFMGEGLMFVAAFTAVIGSFMNKYATKTIASSTVASYNLFFGGIFLTLIGLSGGFSLTLKPEGILVLLYLCFISAFGYTVQSHLYKEYNASKVSSYSFVIPVSGAIFSSLFLGENLLRWEYLLALLLVSAGIFAVNYKKA